MKLTDKAKGILAVSVSINGWYLSEDSILDVAALLERGWVKPSQDYDGVQIYATEAGEKAAKRMKLVERADPSDHYNRSGWSRTTLGLELSK